MIRVCPLCGQDLPKAVGEQEIHTQLERLSQPALARQKQQLEAQLVALRRKTQIEMNTKLRRAEKVAQTKAAAELKVEMRALRSQASVLRQRAEKAERTSQKAISRAADDAARAARTETQAKLERLEHDREQDRRRHRRENDQLQRKVEDLRRKLENQTSDQLGAEGEMNLFAQLRAAFPGDHIEQVERGARGADIIHDVMDGVQRLGRIVYESKNVSTWQDAFVAKAKACQVRYNTPCVLIVARVLPRRARGLCILKGIPVVESSMAVALASLLREGIAEIGKLRLSNHARDGKAQELFNYVLSDEFATCFGQITDSVRVLREQQHKERDWHETAWQAQTRCHDQIDRGRRQIEEGIAGITRKSAKSEKRRMAYLAAS